MKKECIALLSMAVISFGIFSCTKESTEPVQISGKWVESKERADTLVFGYDNLLELKRGKQLSNLALFSSLSGSGLYKYSFKQDSIRLNYLVSSSSVLKSYSFKMDESKLYIGDFYQKNPGKNVKLIFERVR